MKLRNKISLIIVTVAGALAAATFFGSQFIINSYIELESKQATDDMLRVNQAIEQMVDNVKNMTNSWSVWDDTYKFVIDKNKQYIKSNLSVSSAASTDMDFILYFNAAGKPVYTLGINPDRTNSMPMPEKLFDYLSPKGPIVYQPTINSSSKGIISLPSGFLMIAGHPITTSNNTGPTHGTLVMAKYFTNASLDKISQITKVNTKLFLLPDIEKNTALSKAFNTLSTVKKPLIERKNNTLTVYDTLKDINEHPIALLQTQMPRTLYAVGINTVFYYNLAIVIYAVFISLLLWYLLQIFIVKRVERLTKQLSSSNSKNNFINYMLDGIDDEVSSVANLYHQATHDPLTGLANRNHLYQTFQQVKTENKKIAVLFLDIDHFKRINDTLGHEVGDELLIHISKHLSSCLRANDLAVRLGGDEFIVMLIDTNKEHVESVIYGIYQALALPVSIKEHELYITTSMGVSFYPDQGQDIASLIKQADIALYQSKENGRNRFQFYSRDLDAAILEAHHKELELQQAIDRKELCLHYQPIYDMQTKRIISLEALIRWNHPTKGLLSAGDIIPLAEKTALMTVIGKWVLSTACQQNREWQLKKLPIVPVAVNLSVFQTNYASISQVVSNILSETDLDPRYLELELTETGFVEINETILNELHELKRKGIKLSVDDFGVGYSGLGYLKKLPVNKLKIDKSFIKEIQTNHDDRAITLAIISIAHQMNLEVIAEGVETIEQYIFLQQHKVNAIQGYFLSPPLDADSCEKILTGLTMETPREPLKSS